MAVSGRKTKSFESSINRGSAEDYEHICDPCLRDGQQVEAHGYCVECQDYLCVACFSSHSKNKASRHHELLDKTVSVPRNVSQSSLDTCTEKCPKHGREITKFFCTVHETLGCNDCIILNHRTCKIDYIPDACVGFASSDKPAGTLKDLDDMLENITYVQKMTDDKTRGLDEAYKKAEEDIDKFQKEIHDRIGELRNQIMADLDRQRKTKKDELMKVSKTCEKVATDVKQIQLGATGSIAAKRDGQAFISVKRAEDLLKSVDMWEMETALQEIISNTTFQRNKDIDNLFHEQAVLGKISNAREPDAIIRTVRDAVISKSKFDKMMISIAICIGPTFTTYGHSLITDPLTVMTTTWSDERSILASKAPTALLINPDGSLDAFGFDARSKFRDLSEDGKHEQYYYFESFITALYQHTDANETYIEDVNGKKMPAVKVLSLLIRFLKDHALQTLYKRTLLKECDVHWTVTVPEIFVTAKQVMEEAAEQAGIVSKSLTIAFESEAAFMYIQKLPVEEFEGSPEISVAQFPERTKYIVLDAGDNVVTSTVYEVRKGNSKQLLHATLDSFGGHTVNDEFEKFLARLFGMDFIQELKKIDVEGYKDLMYEMERNTKAMSPATDRYMTLRIHIVFLDLFECFTGKTFKDIVCQPPFKGKTHYAGDKLTIEPKLFQHVFKPVVNGIVNHLRFVLQDEAALGCYAIVMFGSFSESLILQDGVTKAFPQVKVVVPRYTELPVLKGAVILGHSLNG